MKSGKQIITNLEQRSMIESSPIRRQLCLNKSGLSRVENNDPEESILKSKINSDWSLEKSVWIGQATLIIFFTLRYRQLSQSNMSLLPMRTTSFFCVSPFQFLKHRAASLVVYYKFRCIIKRYILIIKHIFSPKNNTYQKSPLTPK